jgi:hypothetical protein
MYKTMQLHRKLQEEEEHRRLYRHKLDGWSIWPLFRCGAAWAAARAAANHGQIQNSVSSATRREIIGLAFKDLLRLGLSKRRTPALLLSGSWVADPDDLNRPRNWLFDEIYELLPDAIMVERLERLEHYQRCRSSAHPSQLTNAVEKLATSSLMPPVLPDDIITVSQALARDLSAVPEWRALNEKAIERGLLAFRRSKAIWRAIIRHVGPELLILDNGYFSHGAVTAAKECGVGVVELQHGAFFEQSPEYHWPPSVAEESQSMPLPDQLFLLGKHWEDLLAEDFYWKGRLKIIGSARIDTYRKRREDCNAVQDKTQTLLVTSGGNDQGDICAWITALLKHAANWKDLKVIVKPHPFWDKGKESFLRSLPNDPRLILLDGDAKPSTLELLTRVDFHASIISTCHYEAVALGAITFVLPFSHSDLMSPMILRGDALAPKTPQEMARMMRNEKTVRSGESRGNYYFQQDATNNMRRAIKEFRGAREIAISRNCSNA